MKLLARKVAIAFGIGCGLAVASKAGPAIDAIETGDWPEAYDAARVLAFGAFAGGLRGLVSLLTAFVPSDADVGVNVIGKYSGLEKDPVPFATVVYVCPNDHTATRLSDDRGVYSVSIICPTCGSTAFGTVQHV